MVCWKQTHNKEIHPFDRKPKLYGAISQTVDRQ